MNKFFKKSAAVFMSALVIGSTMLPAMAANKLHDAPVEVMQSDYEISPLNTTISLSTFSASNNITVSWQRPSGAVKYVVTCGSQSKTLKSSDSRPSVKFTGLSSNTNYLITVKAYNSSGSLIASGSKTVSTT